jgi:CHAT domain-containing protein
MRAHQQVMERLALLKPTTPGGQGPACPAEDVWLDIAADIASPGSEGHVNHAAQCDHCGPLLSQAKEDFANELTAEEEIRVADLRSVRPDWTRAMAQRLILSAAPEGQRARKGYTPWKGLFRFPVVSFAATVLMAALFTHWLTQHRAASPNPDSPNSPNQLLASTYKEQRTLETRFEGLDYAPRQQMRSGDAQDRMKRPALLKAEAAIAEHLKAEPNDVSWLQASGRAYLLEEDPRAPGNAVATLEKAHRLAPTNLPVTIDLASAYLARGQIANRPEDFGTAVDLLGSVLAAEPQNEVAQFNYALALEKQLLKRQALAAWDGFLKNHPDSPWAPEARTHLENLQKEILEHDRGSNLPLKSPQEIVNAFHNGNDSEVAAIDDQIERYQDLVIQDWLPPLFVQEPPSSLEATQNATTLLATLLAERHGDPWLQDLLASDRKSPRLREAVQLLAESERLIQRSDDDHAYQAAARSRLLFEQERVPAGMARAQFSTIFIDQLRHRNPECASQARRLAVPARAHGYAWLAIQAEMESGFCSSMSDASGLHAAQHSMDMARAHRYRILAIRAANGVSFLHWTLGDRHKAWKENASNLHEYWATNTPDLRGYNVLAILDYIVQEQQQWFLAVAVLKESIPLIAGDADLAMRAAEQARLGKALLRCGDLDGADRNFQTTKILFQGVPDGTRCDALQAEAELGLAEAELGRGHPSAAILRLNQISGLIHQLSEEDLRLDYFETSGLAFLRADAPAKAQSNLVEALKLTEKGLQLVNTRDDRLTWSRRNSPVYRAMVEVALRTDPKQALAYWEWYKGASLRPYTLKDSRAASLPTYTQLSLEQSAIGPNTAIVTYAFLADGVAVWVWDSHGIKERWLPDSDLNLDAVAHLFIEHCSDPGSSLAALQKEGAEIYREILLPIEPWIAGHNQLIFEPDGILKAIPLEALVDAQGRYLSDRFAITVSPGLAYLNAARKWRGISAASNAFILGDPAIPGWTSLPDAAQEAQEVASSFSHPHLFLHRDPKDVNLAVEMARADVFHFSGHGSTGALSAGIIAGENGSVDAWKLGDIAHRRNQLVVLSACDSSPGTEGAFDDQDSLVGRLVSGGVPVVVASRWNVDSAGTADLMQKLYKQLLTGATVSGSLRNATTEMRSGRTFQHPFYWAGFAVFGRV